MKLDLDALKALYDKVVDPCVGGLTASVALGKIIEHFPALLARLEAAEKVLLGQFKNVRPGDYVKCKVTLGDGYGIVKDIEPLHRMIRLQSGWCLHQNDELVEHISAEEIDAVRKP